MEESTPSPPFFLVEGLVVGARFLRIYSSLFYIIGATTLVADYRYLESGEAHLFNQVTLVLPQYILFEGSIFYIIYLIYIYI